MAQSIYGGRIDNEFDQRLLNTFLERLFTTLSFDSEFKLACKVDGHKDIQMPDGIRYLFPYPDLCVQLKSCFFFSKQKHIKHNLYLCVLEFGCVNICLGHRITVLL